MKLIFTLKRRMNMIKIIKRDYVNVKSALECLVERNIPDWIFILYYLLMIPIGIILTIPLWIFYYIRIKIILRKISKQKWD